MSPWSASVPGVKALAAITLGLLIAAAPAFADVRRAKDRAAGVTFRLNATHLTMKLSEQADARVSKKLLGKTNVAVCGTNATKGGRIVEAEVTWPKNRASIAVDFDRDISKRVAFCLIETDKGADIALVKFPK